MLWYGESDSAGPLILCASASSRAAAASRADDVPWFWRRGGQGHLAARALSLSHRRRSGRQPWRLLDTAVSGSYEERPASASEPRREAGSAGLAHTSDLGRERREHGGQLFVGLSNIEDAVCGPEEALLGSGFAFTTPSNGEQRRSDMDAALTDRQRRNEGVGGRFVSDVGGTVPAEVAAICLK